MPTLTQTNLVRYFAAGTGTRWWVGIKVFKNPGGTNRWWAGHASRRIVNGQFQNVIDISPESMPIVQTNIVNLNIPTPLVFHIHLATLIHPCAAPANYPATLDINLENIRQLIVSLLWYMDRAIYLVVCWCNLFRGMVCFRAMDKFFLDLSSITFAFECKIWGSKDGFIMLLVWMKLLKRVS